MHHPGQVQEGLVGSDSINSPLSNDFRFEGRKKLRKPTGERNKGFSVSIREFSLSRILESLFSEFFFSEKKRRKKSHGARCKLAANMCSHLSLIKPLVFGPFKIVTFLRLIT